MVNKKAQSIAEYAVFIAMMVSAIAMIQLYVKRGLQARYADGADQLVVNLADPALWAEDATTTPPSIAISTRAVAFSPGYQFEVNDISSRKTQDVLEDSVIYKMVKGGNVTREIVTRTANEKGDYTGYDY